MEERERSRSSKRAENAGAMSSHLPPRERSSSLQRIKSLEKNEWKFRERRKKAADLTQTKSRKLSSKHHAKDAHNTELKTQGLKQQISELQKAEEALGINNVSSAQVHTPRKTAGASRSLSPGANNTPHGCVAGIPPSPSSGAVHRSSSASTKYKPTTPRGHHDRTRSPQRVPLRTPPSPAKRGVVGPSTVQLHSATISRFSPPVRKPGQSPLHTRPTVGIITPATVSTSSHHSSTSRTFTPPPIQRATPPLTNPLSNRRSPIRPRASSSPSVTNVGALTSHHAQPPTAARTLTQPRSRGSTALSPTKYRRTPSVSFSGTHRNKSPSTTNIRISGTTTPPSTHAATHTPPATHSHLHLHIPTSEQEQNHLQLQTHTSSTGNTTPRGERGTTTKVKRRIVSPSAEDVPVLASSIEEYGPPPEYNRNEESVQTPRLLVPKTSPRGEHSHSDMRDTSGDDSSRSKFTPRQRSPYRHRSPPKPPAAILVTALPALHHSSDDLIILQPNTDIGSNKTEDTIADEVSTPKTGSVTGSDPGDEYYHHRLDRHASPFNKEESRNPPQPPNVQQQQPHRKTTASNNTVTLDQYKHRIHNGYQQHEQPPSLTPLSNPYRTRYTPPATTGSSTGCRLQMTIQVINEDDQSAQGAVATANDPPILLTGDTLTIAKPVTPTPLEEEEAGTGSCESDNSSTDSSFVDDEDEMKHHMHVEHAKSGGAGSANADNATMYTSNTALTPVPYYSTTPTATSGSRDILLDSNATTDMQQSTPVCTPRGVQHQNVVSASCPTGAITSSTTAASPSTSSLSFTPAAAQSQSQSVISTAESSPSVLSWTGSGIMSSPQQYQAAINRLASPRNLSFEGMSPDQKGQIPPPTIHIPSAYQQLDNTSSDCMSSVHSTEGSSSLTNGNTNTNSNSSRGSTTAAQPPVVPNLNLAPTASVGGPHSGFSTPHTGTTTSSVCSTITSSNSNSTPTNSDLTSCSNILNSDIMSGSSMAGLSSACGMGSMPAATTMKTDKNDTTFPMSLDSEDFWSGKGGGGLPCAPSGGPVPRSDSPDSFDSCSSSEGSDVSSVIDHLLMLPDVKSKWYQLEEKIKRCKQKQDHACQYNDEKQFKYCKHKIHYLKYKQKRILCKAQLQVQAQRETQHAPPCYLHSTPTKRYAASPTAQVDRHQTVTKAAYDDMSHCHQPLLSTKVPEPIPSANMQFSSAASHSSSCSNTTTHTTNTVINNKSAITERGAITTGTDTTTTSTVITTNTLHIRTDATETVYNAPAQVPKNNSSLPHSSSSHSAFNLPVSIAAATSFDVLDEYVPPAPLMHDIYDDSEIEEVTDLTPSRTSTAHSTADESASPPGFLLQHVPRVGSGNYFSSVHSQLPDSARYEETAPPPPILHHNGNTILSTVAHIPPVSNLPLDCSPPHPISHPYTTTYCNSANFSPTSPSTANTSVTTASSASSSSSATTSTNCSTTTSTGASTPTSFSPTRNNIVTQQILTETPNGKDQSTYEAPSGGGELSKRDDTPTPTPSMGSNTSTTATMTPTPIKAKQSSIMSVAPPVQAKGGTKWRIRGSDEHEQAGNGPRVSAFSTYKKRRSDEASKLVTSLPNHLPVLVAAAVDYSIELLTWGCSLLICHQQQKRRSPPVLPSLLPIFDIHNVRALWTCAQRTLIHDNPDFRSNEGSPSAGDMSAYSRDVYNLAVHLCNVLNMPLPAGCHTSNATKEWQVWVSCCRASALLLCVRAIVHLTLCSDEITLPTTIWLEILMQLVARYAPTKLEVEALKVYVCESLCGGHLQISEMMPLSTLLRRVDCIELCERGSKTVHAMMTKWVPHIPSCIFTPVVPLLDENNKYFGLGATNYTGNANNGNEDLLTYKQTLLLPLHIQSGAIDAALALVDDVHSRSLVDTLLGQPCIQQQLWSDSATTNDNRLVYQLAVDVLRLDSMKAMCAKYNVCMLVYFYEDPQDSQLCGWLVTHKDTHFRYLGTIGSVLEAINFAQNCITKAEALTLTDNYNDLESEFIEQEYQQGMRMLYNILIAPFRALLQHSATDTRRLGIIPHGCLWSVPFAALSCPEPLIKDWELFFTPSMRVFLLLGAACAAKSEEQRTKNEEAGVVAGTTTMRFLATGCIGEAEVEYMRLPKGVIERHSLIGSTCTISSCLSPNGTTPPSTPRSHSHPHCDWIHISTNPATSDTTHGSCNTTVSTTNQCATGIQLTDGVIKISDYARNNMASVSLAVIGLSSFNFPSSLHTAKVLLANAIPTVVSTINPTTPVEAAEFSSLFYEHVAEGKQSFSCAFREAIVTMQENGVSPWTWGSLTLFGFPGLP